jgi:hypothetical protein
MGFRRDHHLVWLGLAYFCSSGILDQEDNYFATRRDLFLIIELHHFVSICYSPQKISEKYRTLPKIGQFNI